MLSGMNSVFLQLPNKYKCVCFHRISLRAWQLPFVIFDGVAGSFHSYRIMTKFIVIFYFSSLKQTYRILCINGTLWMLHIECAKKYLYWIAWKSNENENGQWPHIQFPRVRLFLFFSFSFVRSIICVLDSHFSITYTVQSVSFFGANIFSPKLKQWNFDVFVTYSHTFFIFHIVSHIIWIKTHIFFVIPFFRVPLLNVYILPWLLMLPIVLGAHDCIFLILSPTTTENKYPAFDF